MVAFETAVKIHHYVESTAIVFCRHVLFTLSLTKCQTIQFLGADGHKKKIHVSKIKISQGQTSGIMLFFRVIDLYVNHLT
jgi:hypothetical protein